MIEIYSHIDVCYFRWRWIVLLTLRYVYDLGRGKDGMEKKITITFRSNMRNENSIYILVTFAWKDSYFCGT